MIALPLILSLASIVVSPVGQEAMGADAATEPATSHPFDLPAPALEDRIYGLSTLWSEAKFSFAYFDQVPDLDWDAAYRRYVPRVARAETLHAYYRELESFMALLQDGHTDVTYPHALRLDVVPLQLEAVNGRFFVQHASAAVVDDVPVGSEVIEVEGRPVAEHIREEVAPFVCQSTPQARAQWEALGLLGGSTGDEVTFTVRTPDGDRRQVTAHADRFGRGVRQWVPPLPSFDLAARWPAEGIAHVTIESFADRDVPADFDALVPELEKAEAVVLDLRHNRGGHTGIATAVLRHFTAHDLEGSHWSTREHRGAHRAWGAYRADGPDDYGRLDAWTEPRPHSPLRVTSPGRLAGKPLAILTSTSTGSAAEDFLIYAEGLESAVRIGQPTFGSTGQPYSFALPGGGFARICTKRDTWPDGSDFVGVGVLPDVDVPITRADIQAGCDRTMEVALRHLQARLHRSESAGGR